MAEKFQRISDKELSLLRQYREDIKQAVEVMNQGGIILYPTDTIWGIGCDATNETAVRRIFEIKQRADSKALITLVDSEAKIPFYVKDVPDVAWDLIECTEKPLTIIYDHGRNLAANLIAEDGSVAIRVTRETFSRELCMRMKRAIVSTSANISGKPSPQYFNDISENVKQAVDYICTSRQQEKEIRCASSIIKLSEGSLIKIIRE
ncbi:threonylcarbamoyl-AMP synthase [Bacteroidaceae bacterium]|uniref:L-threonylcarbamoyladenylate synthase n=1 Tax=Prevotella sp. MGM2 TaxID=2033406 RepID=UPI000CE9F465|nr:L-threonylcarbamoyladenylate synthase [Prevotella sp. MGM2]GAY30827.1 sua5/YciO/YrdC/YwlC family protein [Prevotella sp. MGM2]GFI35675.1 threonylcarbamoyl-AMP synthase [Bacteroidaceae bacterium]